VAIDRGEDRTALFDHLGVERPEAVDAVVCEREDLYAEPLSCLERCRAAGLMVGLAGNQSAALEYWARTTRLPADIVGSSRWGVRKPSRAFFERVVHEAGATPAEVAYVGNRLDNDVAPAAAAGLVAVHIRRGPWGRLQPARGDAAVRIDSLAELPARLGSPG
jgi:FMN phosphatase YigB (HAD superfamily)